MPLTEKFTPFVFEKPASRVLATPGRVSARKSRPWFSAMPGKLEMLEVEKALVTCASEVSMRGRPELTSTVVVTSPTCKPIEPRLRSAPSVTSISSTIVLLNPTFDISPTTLPTHTHPHQNHPPQLPLPP